MLKLSKKTDYAIILLCHLGDVDAPVSAQEIAGNYQLPQPMVANILKQLGAAGLIQSVRGQHGGYVLALTHSALAWLVSHHPLLDFYSYHQRRTSCSFLIMPLFIMKG